MKLQAYLEQKTNHIFDYQIQSSILDTKSWENDTIKLIKPTHSPISTTTIVENLEGMKAWQNALQHDLIHTDKRNICPVPKLYSA